MLDAGLTRPARSGAEILHDPRLNKITAFSEDEREQLGLLGLVPEGIDTEDMQLERVREQLSQAETPIGKYIFLTALLDNDETLFFRLLMSDPAAYVPLVYTPTVGEACQKFGHIMRRPRGLYISAKRRGRIRDILRNWSEQDVRIIVVTDGERILGLGDLGTNGMGIPIGKLALYTACAGVPPEVTLPIVLDVGTNNVALLADPLYLGLRQPRLRGEAYDELVDEFVTAVQEVFPRCCIQFEDFANVNAIPLLARYRDQVCCFNDDIQGTAAIAVAGIFGGLRIKGTRIADETFLFLGAGSAGTGIADLLVQTMIQEGVPEPEARQRCWFVDSKGLVVSGRTGLADFKLPYAHHHEPLPDLLSAVESIQPTALIGVSTIPKAFTREVIEAMGRINERPIIFPYSNPTSRSECSAEEAYGWTQGRAIFASGSPFPPCRINGRTMVPGQGNNVYIFPAVGMAVCATEARRVTDEMFIVAARAVAEQVTEANLEQGLIYPPMSDILRSSLQVAKRVATYVFDAGLAGFEKPADVGELIERSVYLPHYRSLV